MRGVLQLHSHSLFSYLGVGWEKAVGMRLGCSWGWGQTRDGKPPLNVCDKNNVTQNAMKSYKC